ncbi:MAG: HEAT repeat domain-containing protein [Ardenticatenales bacterium]|nr:HEAT repeat domain-containing protein [Ardenticatenales bacterium]
MSEEKNELPFAEILQMLQGEESLNVAHLYRLSDMEQADRDAFMALWRQLQAPRRRMIVQHLADIMEENFEVEFGPIFTHCLADEDDQVRVAALEGLWDSTDTRLVSRILHLLSEDDSEAVQVAAARALAHFVLMIEWGQLPPRHKPDIVTALLAGWDRPDAPIALKRAALEAVAAADHPRVSELIRDAYGSRRLELQVSAIYAMGLTADPAWIATINEELESPYDEIRAEAARAAGNIGRSDTVERLRQMVDDPEPEVQFAVIEALAQIGSDEASEILNEILEDEEAAHLHEAVEEAMAEMSFFQMSDFTLLDFDGDDDDDEDDDM